MFVYSCACGQSDHTYGSSLITDGRLMARLFAVLQLSSMPKPLRISTSLATSTLYPSQACTSFDLSRPVPNWLDP